MWKCDACNHTFEEPKEINTTYESYYGVSSLFPNSTALTILSCPYCGEESVEELTQREIDELEFLEVLNKLKKIEDIEDYCEEEDRLTFEIETGSDTRTIYVMMDGDDIFKFEG